MMRPMRLLFLLLWFGVCAGSAFAEPVAPVGERIGQDARGRPIHAVQVNGIRIAYKLVGTGQPLVMINGMGQAMDRWPDEMIDALSAKYQLILFDNRGMGRSTVNDVVFTYKLFADDVVGLMDALGVKQANVLGYSMGSTITQELLLTHAERFKKAIIHATSTDGSKVADSVKGRSGDLQAQGKPTVMRQVEATTHWKTPLDKLPLISNQVMLVVGTADQVVGIESSKTIAAAIPGAWLVQFKKGTHMLIYEAPAEFARIVLTFLEMDETVETSKPPR